MFGNLFNNVIATIKKALTTQAVKATAPKASTAIKVVPPKPVATLPKINPLPSYTPYVAKWGDSKATITAGRASNAAQEAALQEARRKQAEEAARAEAARRRFEAEQKFNKTRDEFFNSTKKIAKQHEENQKGDFWSWVTGGFSGENATRDFAQKQLEKLQSEQTAVYDKKLNAFLKEQARRQQELEKTRFKSQKEFEEALGIFQAWESQNIDDLEYMRAASLGMSEAWEQESQKRGSSGIAKFGSWFNDAIVQPFTNNPIFKYTLGSGDENTPSIVTAPSRLLNFIGNSTWNAGGTKNLDSGKTIQGFEKGKNAWTQTFNQRNLNMPYAEKRTEQGFQKWYKERDLSPWKADIQSGRIKESEIKDLFKQMYYNQGINEQGFLDGLELLLDPALGLGKVGKATKPASKWAQRGAEAFRNTKPGSSFFKQTDKIAQSKTFKSLWSEAKTPDQKFNDAMTEAKSATLDLQKGKLARQIDDINRRLSAEDQVDTSVLDDLSKLTDSEAAILQRMVNGKFSFSDRLKLRDIRGLQGGMSTQRDKLLDIAERWSVFAEKMKIADDIVNTRQGRGTKNSFYSPRIDYSKPDAIETYDFTKRKKINTRKNPQSASDLALNARERYLLSNAGAGELRNISGRKSAWLARRDELQKEFNQQLFELRAPVREADRKRGTISRYLSERFSRKTPTTSIGRSLFNSSANLVGLPSKIWKKSVLNYRPAWTVNNVAYNVPASILSGGSDAVIESARLLRPKNFRQAMDEVPSSVKADLTGEVGAQYSGTNPLRRFDSKLTRGYSNIENFSRVAAFRAAKAQGLSDADALKRVNKYLYDYKTRNIERPLKAIMPFWGWTKNLSRASAQIPFDRPVGAKAFHEIDQYQNDSFDREFQTIVPQLTELGYSEDEIQTIKEQQAKYYRGKLKVGDNWFNTPFNAFSDRGLSGVGINPFLTSLSESASATDSFGRPIGGTEALFTNRVLSKFPQYQIGKKAVDSWRVANAVDKPKQGWIGEKGSEGYGLSKERQGFDSSAQNYDRNLDPRANLSQDTLAFFGVPRSTKFDTTKIVEAKKLQKATEAYFDLNTESMAFNEAEAARQAIFAKYGLTSDQFYKGVLSKYDTENTTRIKGLKEEARAANKTLYDEYAAQPKGTRNMWAVNKLRELNEQNYFADNPFKESFDWITPDSVARADKQVIVKNAVETGNWLKYRERYGLTQKQQLYQRATETGDWSEWESRYGRSEKALARDRAVASGDWSEYARMYGVSKNTTPYQYDGKFFKSAESMARYKEARFWEEYAAADKNRRRELLAANPQYNRRSSWSDEQWDEWKADKKRSEIARARSFGSFASTQDRIKTESISKANKFIAKRLSKTVKTSWT